jgi:hypothetical protein
VKKSVNWVSIANITISLLLIFWKISIERKAVLGFIWMVDTEVVSISQHVENGAYS